MGTAAYRDGHLQRLAYTVSALVQSTISFQTVLRNPIVMINTLFLQFLLSLVGSVPPEHERLADQARRPRLGFTPREAWRGTKCEAAPKK